MRDLAYYNAIEKIEKARRSKATALEFRGWTLTELPKSIGRLKYLQSLDLSGNFMTTLPEKIGNLTHLQVFVGPSDLKVLPISFGNLKELKELKLDGNKLRTLPESLRNLTQLQSLNLAHNIFSVLPEWIGQLVELQVLSLRSNDLEKLPKSLTKLTQLRYLDLSDNSLSILPESFGQLSLLQTLDLSGNQFTALPDVLRQLKQLQELRIENNLLTELPDWINQLTSLHSLIIDERDRWSLRREGNNNNLTDLPISLVQLEHLKTLRLDDNPLNPELAEAYNQGLDAVKSYLRTKAKVGRVILNEAKLILVGEGEVGKTCLLTALRDEPFVEGLPTTHGIEIQSFKVTDPETQTELTLNGWDFGGQRVYRPTHQLFFSAPAVYLVVWKPREGPQQGFVKEWIQLVKRREPSAKILVVATHGGPQQRQPDIDRQELWDLFGRETVADFFFVDSKPDEHGYRKGIDELKRAIAQVAVTLPEVGRSVPKSFADVRATLQATGAPYLPLDEVLAICRAHNMDDEIARLFITISHRLGHLTHYENDPALRDIVILRPDWLATAMSYVLDDEETRKAHGLVDFSRLGYLWDDPTRSADTRYPASLHRIFLRLMERFDLSYRVAGLSKDEESNPVSLIAQLVPDTTPKEEDFFKAWSSTLAPGDIQQTQICRIVDAQNGQSANAEGLFYQLIVRLHKYSLGRDNYNASVHWQRGLILDANYNGRALLRHIGNDVHITVRAAFPERFLGMLTEEVKYLVESFWEGLRCDVTVPCLAIPDCKGLFEVSKLIENKKRDRHEQPCSICNEWQSIEQLLSNAPAATQSVSLSVLMKEFAQVKDKLDVVNDNTRRILSQVDKQYADLIQLFTDEAKEGPRLFSLFPVDGNKYNPQTWLREKFRLVLWCEHSRLPLPAINGIESKKGVYDFELDREWFKRAVPFLKFMTGTLSLVLPMMSSTLKTIDDTAFKTLENQLSLGKSVIDFLSSEGTELSEVMGPAETTILERGIGSRAENATLRELHALLKAKDPGFGGLVRVLNKRNEFLWVHEKFAGEY